MYKEGEYELYKLKKRVMTRYRSPSVYLRESILVIKQKVLRLIYGINIKPQKYKQKPKILL
jgi:hypothetical protein